ncbi:MAG TPA: bifunctional UDP-N-acetylglucosamine diphosphorylase/glucosamine-1-phosphate N-acetyltransferase GlmU [Coprothermobacter proteolyticus]|uniref:Bifunctional protein GlmU n=1 Tax=Coprothermobacter proteolyticus (strain ATCC 35245 / DSM 5265 / OCM 4 / BT) TaxID=309798 RepID=B5Y8K8_COPPD|nr:bifunctional UDP-N-acetylglucosamine diphosphorylase/glucosamine-1-phosphate N-acetyltransferase GlmU [Coprothermobacter proteolyticus]ACI16833.1 UDP-N-acetylglucosamine pyrophosphorylase [Coprothermobacter proteolyticus DSM 5265]HOK24187.1 bifunctional UDP-N-acetylglucosamine diphosphorylase/glucosamine-1-phosphate N-acetyltransferase GlmU [Coprothermobacter proteolyticus]HPO83404.1 bifunctional UDP-N-acetylglucosamine diphosphorylase/glucosamine-1-phosphate N-acetyltransferase GlmU [Coproth
MHSAIVLGGGVGKRFNSKVPKIMHTLGEKPIIYHLWDTLQTVDGIEEVILVTSPQIAELLPDNANVVIQDEPLGTAHAAFLGASVAKNENVIIVNADIPLVRKETFSTMVESSYSRLIAVTRFPFESDFGRVRFVDGLLRQIVEVSDLRDRREKEIPFVNTGVYKARKEDIVNGFPLLGKSNAKKEYYITDLFNLLAEDKGVHVLLFEDWSQFLGINTRQDLARVLHVYKQRLLERIMEAATIVDPESTYVGENVKVGKDTIILPNTTLLGSTEIGEDCVIGPNVEIRDCVIGNKCEIKFSVLEEATLEDSVVVGPFARIRPGTYLKSSARIGNFVEIKKSVVGSRTKINHLSYVGDAEVGEDTNIGAGTITCNYDGYNKNPTIIGNRVFIGSDTILVAPVELEDDSFTAAGSVITEKVPKYALGIGRAMQVNKEGWVLKYRKKKEMNQ